MTKRGATTRDLKSRGAQDLSTTPEHSAEEMMMTTKQSTGGWSRHSVGVAALLVVPTLIMIEACCWKQSAMRAISLFHVFLFAMVVFFGRRRRIDRRHVLRAVGAAVAMFVVGVLLFLLCRSRSAKMEYLGVPLERLRETFHKFGVRHEKSMVAFGVYFSVVNPVLEESVWRCAFRRLTKPFYAANDALVAAAFAAYHNAIIINLMPPWFSILVAFPFLVTFGLLLSHIADKCFPTAVGLHIGLDAATAFWVLDLRFGYLDSLFL